MWRNLYLETGTKVIKHSSERKKNEINQHSDEIHMYIIIYVMLPANTRAQESYWQVKSSRAINNVKMV